MPPPPPLPRKKGRVGGGRPTPTPSFCYTRYPSEEGGWGGKGTTIRREGLPAEKCEPIGAHDAGWDSTSTLKNVTGKSERLYRIEKCATAIFYKKKLLLVDFTPKKG